MLPLIVLNFYLPFLSISLLTYKMRMVVAFTQEINWVKDRNRKESKPSQKHRHSLHVLGPCHMGSLPNASASTHPLPLDGIS